MQKFITEQQKEAKKLIAIRCPSYGERFFFFRERFFFYGGRVTGLRRKDFFLPR